ncbi:MAG: hypothetical protein JST35_06495 [Armatimonadetes bacterium]|nr:hypothetical protein [Armatimonadota bacterium]
MISFALALSLAPNRSGLDALKRLADATSKWKDVEVYALRWSTISVNTPSWIAEDPFRLFIKDAKTQRYETSSMWGDSLIIVMNADKAWIDNREGPGQGYVRMKPPALGNLISDVTFGDQPSPLWSFLAGSAAMEKLADPEKDVVETKPGELRLTSTQFGAMKVTYLPGKEPVLLSLEYDNLPFYKSTAANFFFDEIPDVKDPMTRLEIRRRPLRVPKDWFEIKVKTTSRPVVDDEGDRG